MVHCPFAIYADNVMVGYVSIYFGEGGKDIFTNKYIRALVFPSLLFIGMTILDMYYDNGIQWGDNLFLFLFTLVFYNLILFLLKRFKETPTSK